MIKGTIFNIQKFAIYDGPGLRTLIFMKGCPLRCLWCQNPEGLTLNPQLAYHDRICIHCHTCVKVCQLNVIKIEGDDTHIIDRGKCNMCRRCINVCPSGALSVIGREISVDDLIKEIERDMIYYDSSGGGVTFSGGEPLFQPQFLYESLKKCKELSIHTTIETSGYANQQIFKKISEKVDLFLYDVKIVDEELHKKYTGVSNRKILSNLRFLVMSGRGKDIIIRIPLIPTITDTDENIGNIMRLLLSLKDIEEVHLLPFHDVHEKYNYLGMTYRMPIHQQLKIERIKSIKEEFEKKGFYVSLWGVK
ncbi:MAG: glycyl-radical enzyme activating protein [Aigarchaeota archaeon]|nr:glycyl-radical enzyme activating protein [Aigarchaeota archaeon]MCX7795974.1 glycyl-radical enzyme activating protein [bacterium]MDW7985954.1 glycyl-radical enzyme activating protein [Nitrososphaerota archaeon]